MAERFILVIAVVEVVIVGELFAGCDIAGGDDPYSLVNLVSLTVGFATMIDESGGAMTIDDVDAVIQSKKIGLLAMVIQFIGLRACDARPGVFKDVRAFFYRVVGVNTGGMNVRRANDESHVFLVCGARLAWSRIRSGNSLFLLMSNHPLVHHGGEQVRIEEAFRPLRVKVLGWFRGNRLLQAMPRLNAGSDVAGDRR